MFHQLTNVRLFTRSMTDKDDPEVLFLLKRRETETDPNKQKKKKGRTTKNISLHQTDERTPFHWNAT